MPDRDELIRIAERVGQEAWITVVIKSEMRKLALVYGLIPHESELNTFASVAIQRNLGRITNWVITDKNPPSFIWNEVQFLEQKLKGLTRFISICPVPTTIDRRIHLLEALNEGPRLRVQMKNLLLSGYSAPPTDYARFHIDAADRCRSQDASQVRRFRGSKRITISVRIRTWAIYYLTRRGGGIQTEEMSVSHWNYRFPSLEVKEQNYRTERDRLFGRISKSA